MTERTSDSFVLLNVAFFENCPSQDETSSLREMLAARIFLQELFLVSQQPNCVWHPSTGKIKGSSKHEGRTGIALEGRTWSCSRRGFLSRVQQASAHLRGPNHSAGAAGLLEGEEPFSEVAVGSLASSNA